MIASGAGLVLLMVLIALLYLSALNGRMSDVALFPLLGPPIGTLSFVALQTVRIGVDEDVLGLLLFLFVIGVPFGYVIGFVPAAITGLIVALVPRSTPRWAYAAIAAGMGGICSWSAVIVPEYLDGTPLLTNDYEAATALAAVGAVAAATCADITWLRPRRSTAPPVGPADSRHWTGRA